MSTDSGLGGVATGAKEQERSKKEERQKKEGKKEGGKNKVSLDVDRLLAVLGDGLDLGGAPSWASESAAATAQEEEEIRQDELNLMQNLLQSMEAQGGLSGPADNFLWEATQGKAEEAEDEE